MLKTKRKVIFHQSINSYAIPDLFSVKGEETKGHIMKGLEIMRIVSVKYSSPNSVSGRFPGFDRAILAKSFPAYAYISATAPNAAMDGSLEDITTLDGDNIKLFLRLYDTGFACFVYFIEIFFLILEGHDLLSQMQTLPRATTVSRVTWIVETNHFASVSHFCNSCCRNCKLF